MGVKTRRKVYICTTFVERDLMDLYLSELVDYYIVRDLKLMRPPTTPSPTDIGAARGGHATLGDKVIDEIAASDIVIACIEHHEYQYPETIAEIGIAIGFGKPIVICDLSNPPGGNIQLANIPIYRSKNIIHTKTWPHTKKVIAGIAHFVGSLEEGSDSDND